MPVIEIEKGKKYRAKFYYRDDDGNNKYGGSKTFTRQRDAVSWLQSQKDLFNSTGVTADKANVPFVKYWLDWFETFRKPSLRPITADKWMNSYSVMQKFWGRTLLKNIDKKRYQEFINWYGANHAKSSVEKVHVHAHAAVKYAFEEKHITRDFADRPNLVGTVGIPDSHKFLEEEDFIKLKDYVLSSMNVSNISRVMISVAIHTGARLSEIAGLTYDDFDFKKNLITINKTFDFRDGGFGPTKNTQSNRKINVDSKFMNYMHLIVKQLELKNKILKNDDRHINAELGLVFYNQQFDQPPTSNALNGELRALYKTLDIKKTEVSFHGIRHSHVSYLLANGIDIKYISEREGHDSIATTLNTYSHILNRFKKEQISKVVALFEA